VLNETKGILLPDLSIGYTNIDVPGKGNSIFTTHCLDCFLVKSNFELEMFFLLGSIIQLIIDAYIILIVAPTFSEFFIE